MRTHNRRFKVSMFDEGKEIRHPVSASWTAFLNGHWVREKPRKPGKYVIGNKRGRVLGEVFVYFYKDELVMSVRDGALCKLRELTGDFWWWSVRMPRHMPLEVPRWVDEHGEEKEETESPRLYLVK